MKHRRTLFLLGLICCAPTGAWATGTPAIQELRFRPSSELTLGIGMLPLDPFTKGLTGSVGYLLHLSDHLAWRVAEVGASMGFAADLRRDLEHSYGIPEKHFSETEVLATSELVLQLLYGRESFLNRAAIWSATSVSLGGGGVMQRDGTEYTPYPAGVVGLGYKLFFNEEIALRIEARGLLLVKDLDWPEPALWLSLAASYTVSER